MLRNSCIRSQLHQYDSPCKYCRVLTDHERFQNNCFKLMRYILIHFLNSQLFVLLVHGISKYNCNNKTIRYTNNVHRKFERIVRYEGMKALHRRVANDEARGIVAALMSGARPAPAPPAPGPAPAPGARPARTAARKRKIKLLGPRLVFITPHPITPPLFVNAALKYH